MMYVKQTNVCDCLGDSHPKWINHKHVQDAKKPPIMDKYPHHKKAGKAITKGDYIQML